ncbi:hypothetical protein GCM10027035_11500 [Emticicia sediminis]
MLVVGSENKHFMNSTVFDNDKVEKIKRYNFDEIRLILFICTTDLTDYSDENLVCFVEAIEGRVEVLFEPTFLFSISELLKIDNSSILNFHSLKISLQNLYSPQWHKKMKEDNINWLNIRKLAIHILQEQELNYIEPLIFLDKNLEVDWT